jgi:hypothetical protein
LQQSLKIRHFEAGVVDPSLNKLAIPGKCRLHLARDNTAELGKYDPLEGPPIVGDNLLGLICTRAVSMEPSVDWSSVEFLEILPDYFGRKVRNGETNMLEIFQFLVDGGMLLGVELAPSDSLVVLPKDA